MSDQSYLDWPFFEARHRQLKQDLDEWCRQYAFEEGDDIDAYCRALVADLGKAGWLGNCVPAPWGGTSDKLDVRSLALCREALAYHSGLADFAFAMQLLGSVAISLFGTDAQRETYLPAVSSGVSIAAFALSEAEAGSDVAAIATTADATGDGYRIDGEKTWISNGGIADFYCVFARTGEQPGARGLSTFIVEASNPGLTVTEQIDTIAPHPLGTLTFDNCRVAERDRLGNPGEGFKIAMATLDVFRTTVAIAILKPSPVLPRRSPSATRQLSNERVPSGCGAMVSICSVTVNPGFDASTMNALSPRAPGCSPVRANTQ